MKVVITDPFKKDFKKFPDLIKKRMEKALSLLESNLHHPSLQIKKVKSEVIKGYDNVFEGRITKSHRFFFLIKSNAYVLLRCGDHDKFLK